MFNALLSQVYILLLLSHNISTFRQRVYNRLFIWSHQQKSKVGYVIPCLSEEKQHRILIDSSSKIYTWTIQPEANVNRNRFKPAEIGWTFPCMAYSFTEVMSAAVLQRWIIHSNYKFRLLRVLLANMCHLRNWWGNSYEVQLSNVFMFCILFVCLIWRSINLQLL